MGVMRAVSVLLVAACLVAAQADRLSFPLQDFLVTSGSSLHGAVLFSRDEPSLTAFVGDFSSPDEQDDSAWLDSEDLTEFDGGFQTWLDQQLGMLQALVVPPTSPCGGARAAYLQQADPSISYMASSRFGPAVLTTVMQEIDATSQEDAADGSVWESVFDSTGGEVMEQPRSVQQIPDWLSAQEVERQQKSEAFPRTLISSLTTLESRRASVMETIPPHVDDELSANPGGQSWEGPRDLTPPPPPHASCADVMTFAALAIGCVVVWGHLLRSCLSCSRTLQEKKAQRAAAFTANPLLAPLVREDSYSTQDVAVAAAEVPRGSYYLPQGSNYIRVDYAPLRSEQ